MSDELVKRLRMKDEYLPLGHDGWEAADRIEELEAKLANAVEALKYQIAELEERNASLEDLIKNFFILLDKTEETDEGRVFHPNRISSCRAEDGQKIGNILKLMKAIVDGYW